MKKHPVVTDICRRKETASNRCLRIKQSRENVIAKPIPPVNRSRDIFITNIKRIKRNLIKVLSYRFFFHFFLIFSAYVFVKL